jgi:hypothetical protein
MRNVIFALTAAAAFVLNAPVISLGAPMTAAGARNLHIRTASGVEKVGYYFWGYYLPLYAYEPHLHPPIVAPYPPGPFPPGVIGPYPPVPFPPVVIAPYAPGWSYDPFWPQYGWYLDYYQTYGCLSPTRLCIFGELPY